VGGGGTHEKGVAAAKKRSVVRRAGVGQGLIKAKGNCRKVRVKRTNDSWTSGPAQESKEGKKRSVY